MTPEEAALHFEAECASLRSRLSAVEKERDEAREESANHLGMVRDAEQRAADAKFEANELRAQVKALTERVGELEQENDSLGWSDQALLDRASAAEAKAERLEKALRELLIWAKWARARLRSPAMNEPNTGAIVAADAALTEEAEKP